MNPLITSITRNPKAGFRLLIIFALFVLSSFYPVSTAQAQPLSDSSSPVALAALKLIDFASTPKAALDHKSIATLADFVIESKSSRETELPKIRKAIGAYCEFDTRIDFPTFLQYSYTSQIPPTLTSPASLRYSLWSGIAGEPSKLPDAWRLLPPEAQPLVIRGRQHDGITPDLTTEVYYDYALVRTLILFNHKGRHVLISVSKQADISGVGKKGFILGSDDDWNYHYTNEIGSAKAGLGWVKSYIYDYFSVAVYVEAGSSPPVVRSGVFQWIRAGWSGINFARPEHVIKGIKRHAKHSKSILESPKLPAPAQIAATYRRLSALPRQDLIDRYATLQQARHDMAVITGKVDKKETPGQNAWANTPKEHIIEALMLEYFKGALGKSSLLGKKLAAVIH
jgi:hypothetical protein